MMVPNLLDNGCSTCQRMANTHLSACMAWSGLLVALVLPLTSYLFVTVKQRLVLLEQLLSLSCG